MEYADKVQSLGFDGYCCSQILAILMLDEIYEDNEGFVRALNGLCMGPAGSEGCCGCMTGGACVISYVIGKDESIENVIKESNALRKFAEWFEDEIGMAFGGVECRDIMQGNPIRKMEYCPELITRSFEQCMQILTEEGCL